MKYLLSFYFVIAKSVLRGLTAGKRLWQVGVAIFVFLLFLFSPFNTNAEDGSFLITPFQLELVGVHNFKDVEFIQNGFRGSGAFKNFHLTKRRASILHFSGEYQGDAEALEADIKSMVAERFGLLSLLEEKDLLTIRLKRLGR